MLDILSIEMVRIFGALLLLVCGAAAMKSYDGYQLLELFPQTSSQWKLIQTLHNDDELDFWREQPRGVDLFVPPTKLSAVRLLLAEHKISYKVKNDRIQKDIEAEIIRLASVERGNGKAINYDDFNTYNDIMTELDELALRCPSAVTCSTFSVGSSYEGRNIKGLRIDGPGTQGIWLDATIHAREWLATATLLKIVRHLIDDYASDSEVQQLLATYDWHITPIINPDGYDYTWTSDRLWRKNRSPNAGSACIGTDLNRNFEEYWGNAGTSDSPCSETYGGTGPASEVETQAVQNALASVGSSLLFSIHFHTYAQLWLIPWGSVDVSGACRFATDHAEMMVAANAAADAIENTYNTVWDRGNSCATIYPASGITMDYSKARAGIKYTATPELRGNGFVVPASEIEPSFQEVWNGLIANINAIP